MKDFDKRPRPRRDDRRPRPSSKGISEADGPIRLFGVHSVEAALANPKRRIKRLLATENAARKLGDIIAKRGVTVEEASPRDLDRLLGEDTVHQGLMLETEPLPEPTLEEFAELGATGGPLIVLDHVTDPHNVGAILRSAAAFGASGLVMTRRHSPPLNGTLAKSASGALEFVPVLLVQNLAKALEELKEQRFVLLGLEGTSETGIESEPMTGRIAIVLGAEGKGLRELTAQTCDRLVRISTVDRLASLNVSNAAAIALHLAAMRRAAA